MTKAEQMAEEYADIVFDRLLGTYPNDAWVKKRDDFLAGFNAGTEEAINIVNTTECEKGAMDTCARCSIIAIRSLSGGNKGEG